MLLAVLPSLIFGGCRTGKDVSSVYSLSGGSSQTAAEEENTVSENLPEQTLRGTVTGLTEQVITISSDDGGVYLFARDDSVLDPAGDALEHGVTVILTYIGRLEKNEKLQKVRVVKIFAEKQEEESKQQNTSQAGSSETAGSSKPQEPAADSEKSESERILAGMSLEEKVAQMFISRCPASNAVQAAQQYQFGGYILFGRDFKNRTREQVTENIKSYQAVSKIPMFIGVDEEGGTVNRISIYKEFRAVPFRSPRDLYNDGGFSLIQSDTKEKCGLLKSLGINLNFAPVCDVSTDPKDYIYPRSFGRSAAETAEYVKTVVTEMNVSGLGSVLKHFPGYGSNADTHGGIAIDERSLDSYRRNDFLPFKSGIAAGASAVLVSHNIIKAMDAERPASLSRTVHDILRNELGFKGLIITDDLSMGAIKQYTGGNEAAVMAVEAGNDLLCCTDYVNQYAAVLGAVKSGRISEERINESVLRILDCKISLGIIK